MFTRKQNVFILLGLFLLAGPVAASQTSDEIYREAEVLIGANIPNGIGYSPEEVDRGVSLLEGLVESGNADANVFHYLGEGYNDIAHRYRDGSEQREMFFEKEKVARSMALELDPENLYLRLNYLVTLSSARDQYMGYEAMAENSPDAIEIMGRKYSEYPGAEDKAKGINYLRQAYDMAGNYAKEQIGRDILEKLRDSPAELAAFKEIHQQFLDELYKGNG